MTGNDVEFKTVKRGELSDRISELYLTKNGVFTVGIMLKTLGESKEFLEEIKEKILRKHSPADGYSTKWQKTIIQANLQPIRVLCEKPHWKAFVGLFPNILIVDAKSLEKYQNDDEFLLKYQYPCLNPESVHIEKIILED